MTSRTPPRLNAGQRSQDAARLLLAELLGQFQADLAEGMDWDAAVVRLNDLYGRDWTELLTWATKAAARQPIEERYLSAVRKALDSARAEVLAKLPFSTPSGASGPASRGTALGNDGLALDFTLDRDRFTDRLVADLRSVSADALQEAGGELFQSLGRDDVFTMPPKKALEFLKDRENKLTGASHEMFDELTSQLGEGLRLGETLEQIALRLEGQAGLLSRERARVIATTELSAAYGTAQQEAMEQANTSGRLRKRWVTSGLGNVRAEHRRTNGMTVGIDEPFRLHRADGSIEELMHPGDPNGSAENVINCHCIAVVVEEEAA